MANLTNGVSAKPCSSRSAFKRTVFAEFLMSTLLLVSCNSVGDDFAVDRWQVVASSTIIGDVVKRVGGQRIELTVLLPIGLDPHAFEPTPQDLRAISHADLVFINGAGLEEFLPKIIQSLANPEVIVDLSEGIPLLSLANGHLEEDHEEEEHEHGGFDPHVWLDPTLVKVWTLNIAETLGGIDPDHRDEFFANAQTYTSELDDLDVWIFAQISNVEPDRRTLISDHNEFGYFARRYGFQIIGLVIPAFSTMAEPSARDLAALEDTIRREGVEVLITGTDIHFDRIQTIQNDTGIRVLSLYSASLSPVGGPASTYLDLMRYNAGEIVAALLD